ncbi:hypothetical protein [Cytobacillus gottheilii]|uniref:hypothetical protein n=1 Tax=Cytobacillus gottheilii TaxID=859144 RepID=UPI000A885239|nr:hypothetical protein [Cytobacillus gottheilii]
MDVEFIQHIFEIVFKGHLLYLAPLLFLLMSIVFAEQLIGLINTAFSSNDGGRRSRY